MRVGGWVGGGGGEQVGEWVSKIEEERRGPELSVP